MSRHLCLLPLLVLLTSCQEADDTDDPGGEGSGDDGGGDDGGGDDGGSDRVGPEYSQGDCEALVDGSNSFATGDTSYEVKVVLPEEPEGAPVIFAWHWLGGTANQALNYLELEDLAADEDVIIIAPDSDGSAFEWHFGDAPEGNPDLLLFEDLLSCAWQQWDVDLDRIYATGMSAGGLWSSYLTIHEAEWLAATAPLSGGGDAYSYQAPAEPLPVMLTWGGTSDTYGSYSFHDASLFLSDALQDDGSFVVECQHSGGHTLPPWGIGYVWDFFEAHPKGVSPEPWADALPDGMPAGCTLP